LSDTNKQKLVVGDSVEESPKEETVTTEEELDPGLEKALDLFRRINEVNELTEKQQAELEKKIDIIKEREIISTDTPHDPVEVSSDKKKVAIGPPTLTRFEKARIMGARALQLSLGAPPFIPIPETARTSLDIAMAELDVREIPIVIRRVLPNQDYQNIPLEDFE